jgi:hypothetical protein
MEQLSDEAVKTLYESIVRLPVLMRQYYLLPQVRCAVFRDPDRVLRYHSIFSLYYACLNQRIPDAEFDALFLFLEGMVDLLLDCIYGVQPTATAAPAPLQLPDPASGAAPTTTEWWIHPRVLCLLRMGITPEAIRRGLGPNPLFRELGERLDALHRTGRHELHSYLVETPIAELVRGCTRLFMLLQYL